MDNYSNYYIFGLYGYETHLDCEICGEMCDSVTFSDAGRLCDECRKEE